MMGAAALPIAIGLTVAGTAASAYGMIRQGQAQAEAARYNAQIAQQNAQIAQAQGEAAAESQAREAQRKQGAAVALYGAAGVDAGSGSPSDVLADNIRNATLDHETIKWNAGLKAQGFGQQSALDRMAASSAMSGALIGATAQLLSGGAKVAGMESYGYQTGQNALFS
jgi:hypothetical protein